MNDPSHADCHEHAHPAGVSPCSKPCDDPCSEPCAEPCEEKRLETSGFLPRLLNVGFKNALHIAFDELLAEPKRILMIGGCRQREFAKYLAFLLPATDIYVLDPDAKEVADAQAEICCRFKFVHASLEDLPFESDFFDLTLAHHLFQYVSDWEPAMAEIGRVSRSHFLFTAPRPNLWRTLTLLPGVKNAFKSEGLAVPKAPEWSQVLTYLNRYGKIRAQMAPWPWNMYMVAMKPIKEERTILEQEMVPA